MMLNPDVDGYTKTLNPRKILYKRKNNVLLKTKIIAKAKYKLGGGLIFTFSLPGSWRFAPLSPVIHAT